MTSALAAERAFPVYPRGRNRDDLLMLFRNGLRKIRNPKTNQPFSEDEIAAATARQSRWYIEADALDQVLLVEQQRGLFLASQIHPGRATTEFLRGHHRSLWRMDPLPANGGSGPVAAPAPVGTIWVGSTTIPDRRATKFRDPAGRRYQVLYTTSATLSGAGVGVAGARLELKAIDAGPDTNPKAGTVLTYIEHRPLAATQDVTVLEDFRDGIAAETDAAYAKRMLDRMNRRPASGNDAHFRLWAREANIAVEDAFVYPCAFHAGSVLVCITSKRGTTQGPIGRIPTSATLSAVRAYLTPPGSPVVPKPPHVLVVSPQAQSCDMELELDMRLGSANGWSDTTPWPAAATKTEAGHFVSDVDASDAIEVTVTGGHPPNSTPSLMVWDHHRSRFVSLDVQSVEHVAEDRYRVTLSTAPATPIEVGMRVSPDNGRRDLIAQAIESYFDSLGPGEVVPAEDDRAHRAFRVPEPFDEYPQRAGAGVTSFIRDALSVLVANESLADIRHDSPALPAHPAVGPTLIVAGKVGVYPSTT